MKVENDKHEIFQSTVNFLRGKLGLGKPEIKEVSEDPKSPESSSDDPASEDAPDLQAQLDQAKKTIAQRDATIKELQTTLNELGEEVKTLGNRSAKNPVVATAEEDLQKTEKTSPFSHLTQMALDQYNNTIK